MLALATKCRLSERPGVSVRTFLCCELRACQRVSVVRAGLGWVRFTLAPLKTGSLRLHRDAADPTGPRLVVVMSLDITSLSQKLSGRLRAAASQRSLHKSEPFTETWKEMFTLAVFHSGISTAARDQTTRKFWREMWNMVYRGSFCPLWQGDLRGEVMWKLNTLQYLVKATLRNPSECLSACPPNFLPSVHPCIHLTTSVIRLCHMWDDEQSDLLTDLFLKYELWFSLLQKFLLCNNKKKWTLNSFFFWYESLLSKS